MPPFRLPRVSRDDRDLLLEADAALSELESAPEREVRLRLSERPLLRPGPGIDSPPPSTDDTEEETLESIRLLWESSDEETDAEPAPPAPMAYYNEEEFRFILGAKQGPLVRLGLREDVKTQILQALSDFNTREEDAARRHALTEVIQHCQTYVTANQAVSRKSGRVTYVRSLMASADWERESSHPLSPRLTDVVWKVNPAEFSRSSGILPGLMALDQGIGIVQDLMVHGEEREAALGVIGTAATAASRVNSAQGQGLFSSLKGVLESVSDNISLESLAELAGTYLEILDFIDCSGISNLLTSHQAFKDYKKTKKRIKAMTRRRASKDPFIKEFCEYGIAKLARRQYSNFFLGAMNFVRGVTRLVSLLSAGAAAMVSETLNQTAAIATAVHEFARNAKGVYKWVIGTRSVARKTRAAMLIWRASLSADQVASPLGVSTRAAAALEEADDGAWTGAASKFTEVLSALHDGRMPTLPAPGEPTEAMQLFKEFLEPDFKPGFPLTGGIRKKVWDTLWSHGHEGVRSALSQSISIVRSDTSSLDALQAALKQPGAARGKYLAAARVALGVQSLVFNALNSRPKYIGGSAMQNLQDSTIESLLGGLAS
jgi:hypothetical protein